MKMKKMLAILAALSVLGTTGLTVGAEDTATTTEPATEAITTTETEAETTAAETTAETETTVETAAAEENQTVKEEGTKKVLTSKTIDFGQHTSDPNVFTDETLSVEVYYLLNEEEGPVYLSISINGVASNLTGIVVKNSSLAGDPPSIEALCNIDNYFKQSGENSISINVCGTWTEYDYVDGQFVPAGTAPTTTAATTDITTTTTTTTTGTKEEVVTGDFVLDGVTLTPKVEYSNKEPGLDEAWLYLNIYSQDGTLLVSVPADTYVADDGRPENYGKVGRYLVKTGSNTITVIDYSGSTVKYHSYVFENGKFVSTGTTTDDNQEKTFTVEIPTSYVKAFCYKRGQEITESNYKDSMVISCTTITGCTNGTVSIVPNGYFVGGFLVKDAKPGTITITGTTGTFSSSEDPNVNTSHGQCGAGIGDRLDSFTVTVTIDENGNIVTGGSDNGDSGKTDNGSASNAPATKNTSGTPKTGDMTTVPAVAVGLTLTAAGVVAFISKRKK
ncbi:LPXTG cell wall anchor domain-containing protein [Ruminococcus sp.]|uniref:LPXTG cell wall anchor domain-containing protein n=1 Tax=Ruminococcus sp. TaxID=41978 RepID=UPI002EA2A85B|nr:LPXTG cell wall anchor domain-containing protein [Ruminococcus sp.]